MIGGMLRTVCALSIVFGVVLTLTDDEGVSHVLRILCTCILLVCVLGPVKQIDFESLSIDMAAYRAKEKEIISGGEKMSESMNREVIENEYASYIEEKAGEMGVRVRDVKVKTKWDMEGIWVPDEAYIEFESEGRNIEGLKKTVKVELGIPEERQIWIRSEK